MRERVVLSELLSEMKDLERRQDKIERTLNRYFTFAEQVILSYEVSIGRKESIISELSDESKMAYANACMRYLNFGKQVDAGVKHTLHRRDALEVCQTPQILLDFGMPSFSMHLTQKHLNTCIKSKKSTTAHSHGLEKEDVKRLPEALENPILVGKSLTNDNTWIVGLGYEDSDGLPIIATIAPNGEAMQGGEIKKSNFITSIYGRTNFPDFVRRMQEQGKLFYLSKEKSSELALVPLQLRQGHLAPASSDSIRQSDEDVNKKSEEKLQENGQVEESAVPKFGTAVKHVPKL